MFRVSVFGVIVSLAVVVLLLGCTGKSPEKTAIKVEAFGKTAQGKDASLYTLKNRNGMEARITNYGGIIVSLLAPDKGGKFDDIVLGYEALADYLKESPYFGALIGRYGNRIQKGKFTLNGVEYRLAVNNGANALHGGLQGFDKVVWDAKPVETPNGPSLELTYVSKDGEEGYPGNLSVKVTYLLTDNNELKIDYAASTDKPTVINLTHHSYFNLAGAGKGDILGHELFIDADRFTPVDSGLIPTGELRAVQGTPMDFTSPTAIGARINNNDDQLRLGGGYDHNWVLNAKGTGMRIAARVHEPGTGRVMEVLTTEPGLQFYSGNFLNGTNIGKGGIAYKHRYGFCLETQHFPDSPNKPEFPSTVLNPGTTYTSTTIYKFTTR